MNSNNELQRAMTLPGGARFYRCALQVNPFEYLQKFGHSTAYSNDREYSDAIVQACRDNGIEVIAVTDHFTISSAKTITEAASRAGIHVFPAFEAVTKEGVHVLCLFDKNKETSHLERVLGACGILSDPQGSPTGKYDFVEMLEKSKDWECVCVAAHVASDGGLLKTLSGQARINAWTSERLLACSLPGPANDAPESCRSILLNTNPEHRRDRPVAIINVQDVSDPADVNKDGATCLIKMSEVSLEGLRQAFLDPTSRVRLSSDPVPDKHTEILAIAWQGGFLDDIAIRLNENLNVLIGGRGTGKSTVVESLRYALALEPLGDEARKTHEGILRQVLGSGTKISLLVRSYSPAIRDYKIERTIPNPPTVRDESGKVLPISPEDVVSQAEVFGQHEISELAKSPEKRTRLLDRFIEKDDHLQRRKAGVLRQLDRTRSRILDLSRERAQLEEHLAALPALEETLRRFQDAGLEERLKEQSLLVREQQILKTSEGRLQPFQAVLQQLRRDLPIDRAFLAPRALDGLPGKSTLEQADGVLQRLEKDLEASASSLATCIEQATEGLGDVRAKWEERRKAVQDAYEKILRDLRKSKVDGEEFIRLRQQIEELKPLRERSVTLERDLRENQDQRRTLLAEWEDAKGEEFRQLQRAAKRVNKKLAGRVRVMVTFSGNREPLFQLLKEKVGGRLAETIDALRKAKEISLKELADAARAGPDVLSRFSIPATQADRIAHADPLVLMRIEELDLPPTTEIELNVSADEQQPAWQKLDDLSTGQKATAVLLLLLLESEAPLIVDQPEDDLDNRFITDGIVPRMREEKRRRQFIFATHNANIPVLGDAELIIGLQASGEAGQGKAEIPLEHRGSIDARPVRELIEEVLEGGRAAFEMRRLKYGLVR